MPILQSAQPSPDLRFYVRAYAQRRFDLTDQPIREFVPAELEQILDFELGIMPGIHHQDRDVTERVFLGGSQTSFSGFLNLQPGVESFAVFFQPAGWTLLFGTPMAELTNHIHDAHAIAGPSIRILWNQLGELPTFGERVNVIENYLRRYIRH